MADGDSGRTFRIVRARFVDGGLVLAAGVRATGREGGTSLL